MSFGDVEDLLAERGNMVDEVYLKIDGRLVYLWRAVDAKERFVQTKRNKAAALKC